MIVVADTSSFVVLVAIGHIDVLPGLVGLEHPQQETKPLAAAPVVAGRVLKQDGPS